MCRVSHDIFRDDMSDATKTISIEYIFHFLIFLITELCN